MRQQTVRERQIALTGRLVKQIGRFAPGRSLLRVLQRSAVTARGYRALVGYRRPFASLAEAKLALHAYAALGHEGITNVRHHLELSERARPSDYAALFHLRPLVPDLGKVFDLGGNAGNLFYCYARYLPLRPDLRWTVLDLPANMAAGAEIARERGAAALHFAGDWTQASGVDLLLVCGSLHYFDKSLPEMVGELPVRPAHILINRTPLVEGAPAAAVQVASGFRLACMLYNRRDLLGGLEALGYRVVDEWKAPELSMDVPGYPEYSVPAYSGAFLRRNDLP